MNTLASEISSPLVAIFMTTPYDKYKNTKEWKLIEKAIQELIGNQDIQLNTPNDYVVGYITKHLIDKSNVKKP